MHKVPEFTTFASLLRMATKYGFSDVREALVESLKGAYPTQWAHFAAARVLGEDIFGSPRPHPSVVLNLFLEQDIKFALPFATYRACVGGFQALVRGGPGTVLPHSSLLTLVHGMGTLERVTIHSTHLIAYTEDLGVCPETTCILSASLNSAEQRVEALNKVFDAILEGRGGDVLSPLSLGATLVCVNCAKKLENISRSYRKRFLWDALPCLLGWESWEGV